MITAAADHHERAVPSVDRRLPLLDTDLVDAETARALSKRYPTEREFEGLLDRRTLRRPLGAYTRPSLDQMVVWLTSFLDSTLDEPFVIREPHWFVGGASKIQMGFTLAWTERGVQRNERLVVRMEPAESLNVTSRLREFEVLRAMRGVVPVPQVNWTDDKAEHFPEPALIYAFSPGVTKPSGASSGQITGLGTDFGPRLRALLAPQFVEQLAAIHRFDTTRYAFTSMDRPDADSTQAALWQLNRARRVWDEDRGEEYPLMDVASNWLERNAVTTERISVVHGDYRSGNFLFDEPSGRIVAWLDWERSHLGDRHRDLAWTTQLPFGHFDDRGEYLVCGLLPREDFLAQYSELSGLSVDEERLRYFRVLNCYQIIVAILGTAYRVVRLGRSHQDVMLARLKGEVAVIADDLRAQLKEAYR